MPSPFPGMDPYLEAPDVWPGVHHALATEIRTQLNRTLPGPYYADLEMRPELGIVEEWDDEPRGPSRRIVPDVLLLKHSGPGARPCGTPPFRAPSSSGRCRTSRCGIFRLRSATRPAGTS